jgi:lipopolysaccharide transport system ATP-binding protein
MSDEVAISVENLSKRYIISHRRSASDGLRHVLQEKALAPWRALRGLFRNSQPSTAGNISAFQDFSVSASPSSEEFWALKDVSFEVKQGEVLGIIGRNGAGKSTLLKILSRITEPTNGRVTIEGRVASLLEVGTGFHPELTGRENIFLNGAILGMSRAEIKQKFDEIVAFSEVEKFLDTPVKRYSSGMYVRLAFSVAAHLNPEILIVDEVLAVGDAQFQKKCMGKMQDVAGYGKTVLFVSHNMAAIGSLCTRAILLREGALIQDSTPHEATAFYLNSQLQAVGALEFSAKTLPSSQHVRFLRAAIRDEAGQNLNCFDLRKPFCLEVEYEVLTPTRDLIIGFDLLNSEGVLVCGSNSIALSSGKLHSPGTYKTTCRFPGYLLNENRYQVRLIASTLSSVLLSTELCLGFDVEDVERHGPRFEKVHGVLRPELQWRMTAL